MWFLRPIQYITTFTGTSEYQHTKDTESVTVSGSPRLMHHLHRSWTAPLAIAMLAFLAYAGTCTYSFASDDVAFVGRLQQNGADAMAPFLSPETGARGESGYFAYYRPVQILLTAWDYLLWGTNPTGYHLTNLLMFVLASVLVWYLVRQVTNHKEAAFWAGIIFAIHPIHTMNAIWISGRTDSGAALGVLLALCAFVKWRQTEQKGWLAASLAGALFGLGSKEMAYTLPALGFITEWTRLQIAEEKHPISNALKNSLPLWFITALWGGIVLSQGTFVSTYGWRVGPAHIITNLGGAVALLVLPFGYEELVRFFFARPALLFPAALGVMAAGVAGVWFFRRNTAARWGLGWIALSILPLYRVTMRWYLYLPSVGFAIAVGALIAWYADRKPTHARVVGAVLVLLFAVGLTGERIKWHQANAVTETALESLASLVDGAECGTEVILVTTPAKVRRMPVFGGNTERFLHMALLERGVPVERLPVVRTFGMMDLENPAASPHITWTDSTHIEARLGPGEGCFVMPHNFLQDAGRPRPEPGGTYALENRMDVFPAVPDSAEVLELDENGRAVALRFKVRRSSSEIWGNLNGGRFVHLEVSEHVADQ